MCRPGMHSKGFKRQLPWYDTARRLNFTGMYCPKVITKQWIDNAGHLFAFLQIQHRYMLV